jgi:hypothetical protein
MLTPSQVPSPNPAQPVVSEIPDDPIDYDQRKSKAQPALRVYLQASKLANGDPNRTLVGS